MQILKAALFVLLLAPFSLSASSDGEWISRMRKGHSRMFFNYGTWPQIQAKAHGKAKPETLGKGPVELQGRDPWKSGNAGTATVNLNKNFR